jgi:hypothetical protein
MEFDDVALNVDDYKSFRPKYIGQFLDQLKEKEEKSLQLYNDYDSLCLESFNDLQNSNFTVNLSYKSLEYSNSGDHSNSSLLAIFGFYSRMEQVYTATFSLTELANETMSYNEANIFCSDFNIYRLVSRDDVKSIFQFMQNNWVSLDLEHKKMAYVLDFDLFCEFIIRVALVAYNKKGFKRLILSVKMTASNLPSSKDVVKYFCHYLKLDDEAYVTNHIQTVGRKTQGQINYRSVDEVNTRVRDELLQDKNMKSDNSIIDNASSRSSTKSLKSLTSYQSKVNTVISMNSTKKLEKSRLPGKMKRELYKTEYNMVVGGNCGETDGNSVDPTDNNSNFDDVSELNSLNNSISNTSVLSHGDTAIFYDDIEDILNEFYDASLLKLLEPYKRSATVSSMIKSAGPYINMGSLKKGSKIVMQANIMNRGSTRINIDVLSQGFDSAVVMTHPGALIQGFTRNVIITFTVPQYALSGTVNLCYIQIHFIAKDADKSKFISCPVIYKAQ